MKSSSSMSYLQNQIQHKTQGMIVKTDFLDEASIRRIIGIYLDMPVNVTPYRERYWKYT